MANTRNQGTRIIGNMGSVAAPMLLAQMAGGWTGAHLAIRGGNRFIRLVVVLVALALVVKVARDIYVRGGN